MSIGLPLVCQKQYYMLNLPASLTALSGILQFASQHGSLDYCGPQSSCAAEDVSHDWAAERAQADDNAFKCKYYRFLATRVCINNMLIYYCCTKLSGGWKFKAKCCDEVK